MARDQRRLAAIVSADVAGYSRLMGQDESGTLAALKAHRRELIDPKIAEYGGRIVKTTGDGLLLEFPSVVEAVRCAVDVQRGMAERNAGIPAERHIEFRVGINVGDIILDGEDIYGDGVNVAARLQTLAEPGGICVSRVVRDQVLDKLSFAFDDLGAQDVKNITRPVQVYRVRLEATPGLPIATRPIKRVFRTKRGWWFGATVLVGLVAVGTLALYKWQISTRSTTASIPGSHPPPFSVAVLPFRAVGRDVVDLQFADLLTQGIANALRNRMHYATIVSSQVATTETGKPRDARALGRERNVRYLIDGDVHAEGDTANVTTKLLDADTAGLLWSDQFKVERSQWIADSVGASWPFTSRLSRALWRAESQRVAHEPPGSASAMDFVVRGALVDDGSLKGALEARQLYDEALHLDPRLTIALVSRAGTSWTLSKLDPNAKRSDLAHEMDEFSRRAVASDRADYFAWIARAWALLTQWRWDAALEATAEAMRIEPHSYLALHTRGWILSMTGRADETLVLIDKAIALDPRAASDSDVRHSQCYALLLLGQFGAAVKSCEQSVAAGDDWWPSMFLTAAYAQAGDMPRAMMAKAELLRRRPGFSIAQFNALGLSDNPVFLRQNETNFLPGLRRAGVPEN